jgi:hypothetical protein
MMTIRVHINEKETVIIDVVNRGRSGGIFTYSIQRFDRITGKVTNTEITLNKDEGRMTLLELVFNKLKEIENG